METIDYYRKRRKIALIALGGKCQWCGDTQALEIDHIDPSTKTINLGTDWYNIKWWHEVLTLCQLLCNPCHLIKSAEESRKRMLAKGYTHGSSYAWMKLKCKCDLCDEARNRFNQARRQSRRVEGGRGPYNQPVDHGTKRMYSRGCKCDLCRAANAAHAKAYKEARKLAQVVKQENTESLKDSA